jgi:hypothetical protein
VISPLRAFGPVSIAALTVTAVGCGVLVTTSDLRRLEDRLLDRGDPVAAAEIAETRRDVESRPMVPDGVWTLLTALATGGVSVYTTLRIRDGARRRRGEEV